jgi:23S rRNA C2498 (ribose-2'-O)-methylase RlmM
VAHEKRQVCVYNLNKSQKIQEIPQTLEEINSKGKILAVEWIYNDSSKDSQSFAIGFSEGSLEIYKAESKS